MLYEIRKHKTYGYWLFEWLTASLKNSISIEQEKRKKLTEKRSSSHASPLSLGNYVNKLYGTSAKSKQPSRQRHPIHRTPRDAFPTTSGTGGP